MNMYRITGIFLLLIITALSSCYYDKEETLYPVKAACDTLNVTYSAKIAPVMSGSCNACHSTAIASGGVITDNHAALKTIADNGRLMGAITHATGFSPMPKGGNKLSDCVITQMGIWVNQGSPNN